ncbi:hypothetical protein L195_g019326, partial [Trifolium pratense]
MVVTYEATARNIHLVVVDLMDVIKEREGAKEWAFYMGLVCDLMAEPKVEWENKVEERRVSYVPSFRSHNQDKLNPLELVHWYWLGTWECVPLK